MILSVVSVVMFLSHWLCYWLSNALFFFVSKKLGSWKAQHWISLILHLKTLVYGGTSFSFLTSGSIFSTILLPDSCLSLRLWHTRSFQSHHLCCLHFLCIFSYPLQSYHSHSTSPKIGSGLKQAIKLNAYCLEFGQKTRVWSWGSGSEVRKAMGKWALL